jgi:hypothetical protein
VFIAGWVAIRGIFVVIVGWTFGLLGDIAQLIAG